MRRNIGEKIYDPCDDSMVICCGHEFTRVSGDVSGPAS